MRNFKQTPLMIVVLLGLLMFLAACGGDDDPAAPSTNPTVEPVTTEELLQGIHTAYESRDLKNYLAHLDPDFSFVLHPQTVNLYPDLGGELDYDLEKRIHQRMFSGEAIFDPDGNPRPSVQQIYFNKFEALDVWKDTDDVTRYPNTVWAPFVVDLIIDCGPLFTTYRAKGQLKIYAREHIRTSGGQETRYFKLAGVVDLTDSGKGVENTPWGLIKVFYR